MKTGLVSPVSKRRVAMRLHRARRHWRQGAAGLVVASLLVSRTALASHQPMPAGSKNPNPIDCNCLAASPASEVSLDKIHVSYCT